MSNARLDQMMVMFVNSLGNDYYVDQPIPGDQSLLTITQRAPVGSRWANGQKFRLVGKMSRFQGNAIESISPSIGEGAERIRLLIVEGKDTTKAEKPPSAEQLTEMVAKLAAAEVDKRMKEIESGTARRDLMESAVVRQAVKAIPKTPPPAAEGEVDVIAMWGQRAKIMGIRPPGISRNGKIDGRWMRFATVKWAEHEAQHPETAGA